MDSNTNWLVILHIILILRALSSVRAQIGVYSHDNLSVETTSGGLVAYLTNHTKGCSRL